VRVPLAGAVLARSKDVTQPFVRRLFSCALAIVLTGCSSTQSDVQQHAEKIDSLRASAVAVINAWLAGDASGTYTRATLQRTFQLVEQERAAVAATPEALALPAANSVARAGEDLARVLAALSDAVRRGDGASARRHLGDLPRRESTRP
jgi:hypothetical protein